MALHREHERRVQPDAAANARFSDGTPVTASAVKAWLDYAYFKVKGYITSSLALKDITTSGNDTVVLHLPSRTP